MTGVNKMAFDGNFTHALITEIAPLLRGKINRIQQMDKSSLILKIRSGGKNHQLLISAHPMYARFHLTQRKYDFPFDPPMFLRVARKHLEGGIINDIKQVGNDRKVHIHITSRNEIGDTTERILILEIMGKHSNIIIADENYKIIEGIKHLTPNNNARTIMPGFQYEAPPTERKLNPRTEELDELPKFIDFNKGKVNRQILTAVEGFSPLFINEVQYHAHHFTIDNIVSSIRETMTRAETIKPVLYQGDKDIFYFTELAHLDTVPISYSTLSDLLDDYFHNRYQMSIIRQKANDYLQVIEREHDKVERKIVKLKAEMSESEEKELYQKYGELITAYMHQIKQYDTSAQVFDYYTNEEISIPLEEQLTPSENAQRYYRLYNKLKNREESASVQLKKAEEDLDYYNNLLHQMETITTEDEVEQIREELMEEGIIKFKSNKGKKKKPKIELHQFTTGRGLDILVGKNNKQNDYLTTRKAQNNHLWFHTKDIPGSHVVITHSPGEINDEDIMEAAEIAAYYSKAGHSESVPVDYTEIKHVHKVSGAKPGFVTYTDQKTVYVTPDKKHIETLEK
jgi:predicted ribosome quality control (RQC) complex YloA/Tae2 family protein